MTTVSNKKYTIAGTSRKSGRLTYRFANGDADARIATLKRFGHTGIKLQSLQKAMTKTQAIAHLVNEGSQKAVLPTRSPNLKHKSLIVAAAMELAKA